MDTSPTALFDSYEQDFQQFIETIRQKLEGEGKDEPTGERSQDYQSCKCSCICAVRTAQDCP